MLVIATTLPQACFGQTGNERTSQPTQGHLRKFLPFFGKYDHSLVYDGEKLSGVIEVKNSTDGTGVEVMISTKTGDRVGEAGWLISWDESLKDYQVRKLADLSTKTSNGDAYKVRSKRNEFTIENKWKDADGGKKILWIRWKLLTHSELRVTTEHPTENGGKRVTIQIEARRIS